MLAALAALLSSTLCSQSLVEFTHGGVAYVGVPVPTWEAIVARRLDANELNRSRARTIALLRSDVADADTIAATYRADVAEARQREREALNYANAVLVANGELSKKLRRRTPWATAMKVEVGIIVIGAGIITYKQLRP